MAPRSGAGCSRATPPWITYDMSDGPESDRRELEPDFAPLSPRSTRRWKSRAYEEACDLYHKLSQALADHPFVSSCIDDALETLASA